MEIQGELQVRQEQRMQTVGEEKRVRKGKVWKWMKMTTRKGRYKVKGHKRKCIKRMSLKGEEENM